MILKPIIPDLSIYPAEFRSFISGAKLYDSSCSEEARVIFIEKGRGYFLKSAAKGALEREAQMTRYFHSKGLSAEVLYYLSKECDWLLTEKISGEDCTAEKYLERPERLTDTLAECLAMLHAMDCSDCPVSNHTKDYLARAQQNKCAGVFYKRPMPDELSYKSKEEAWPVVEAQGHLLKTDTFLHGDYCLPNIILEGWNFSGFIDVDSAGIGDRHVDIFWATWSLFFNLKTDQYRKRFIDAYGRDKINEDMLRVIAAVEVFG